MSNVIVPYHCQAHGVQVAVLVTSYEVIRKVEGKRLFYRDPVRKLDKTNLGIEKSQK